MLSFLTMIALINGILGLVIRGFIAWVGEMRLKEELNRRNYEMELALIRSQLSPHFLFNTLNNIDVLIAKDAVSASRYLNKLSEILRFMLYETKSSVIPIGVTDYLLKPYTFERWVQSVDRARENLAAKSLPGTVANGRGSLTPPERKFIFIRTEYRLEKLVLDDLLFIEGKRDYRQIHAVGRQITSLRPSRTLEKAIPPGIACRVHKSYMVALGKIETVEKGSLRIGQATIPVSDTYRGAFLRAIGLSNGRGH